MMLLHGDCLELMREIPDNGDAVLDNCVGGGSTGVACVMAGREFIGVEKERKYFEIAKKRSADAKAAVGATAGEILKVPRGSADVQVRVDGF